MPAYRITDFPAPQMDPVPDMGRVDVTDATIVISYTGENDSTWEVEYRRVENPDWYN